MINLSSIYDKIISVRSLTNPFLIIIMLASVLLGSSVLTRGHEWGDDFASYIMQAQSILNNNTGNFVERNTFTIFKSSIQIGPVAYPWGYPLILVPSLILKGVHPLALKLPGLFLFLGFLLCLFHLTENRITRTESMLLVALFAFNPILIKHLDYILSDIPFLFFTFLALLWIMEIKNKDSARNNFVTGAVLFLAFFIRTTGIILFASYLAYQMLHLYQVRENRRDILMGSFVSVLAFGGLGFVTSLVFPNGQGSYLVQLKGLTPDILQDNISNYFSLIGTFFGASNIWKKIYYALVFFSLLGMWTRRNNDTLLVIFFFLYFSAMVFWPEWQGIRFVFPLLPLLAYFSIQGMKTVINPLPERCHWIGRGLFFCFWLAVVTIFFFKAGNMALSNLQDKRKINGPFDSYSSDMFNFVRTETSPGSVIVFFKPRAMRLFTDRDSIMSLDCERLLLGDYAVIHKTWEYSQIMPDEIQDCKVPLKTVFESKRYIVYKIIK